jgi:multiple sugar transport system substrate-binding protein
MKVNRKLSLMLVVVLLGIMVFQMIPPQATAAGKITLRWYLRWDQERLRKVAEPVKEEYEKLHPNIDIVIENIGSGNEYWTKLQTMAAAGVAPDVVYPATHNGYALASKGQLLDLTPFIKKDKISLDAYNEQVMDLYKIGNKVFGLPLDSAALVVFYNKDMFDAAGVPYPKEGWTWDDFLATSKKLVKDTNGDGRIDQYAFHQFYSYWPVVVWAYSGHNIFNDPRVPTKLRLNDAKSIQALQVMADWRNVHKVCLSPSDSRDLKDMFLSGNAAMSVIGMWRWVQYDTGCQFKWGIAPLPREKYFANRADGSCFAITKNCKYPKEAWEFVKYLAAPGAVGARKMMELQQMTPALKELAESDEFLSNKRGVNKRYFLAGRKDRLFSMYDPIHPLYDKLNSIMTQDLEQLWNGKADAKAVVASMTPKILKELEAVKEK